MCKGRVAERGDGMSGRCVPGLRVSYGYKRLVKDVFPRDAHSSELNTRELERMTVYALTNTDKLTKIGLYIERRVGKKFARREYGHLRCAIAVLHNLMLVCHVDLRLFADSVVRLTKFLLRQAVCPPAKHHPLPLPNTPPNTTSHRPARAWLQHLKPRRRVGADGRAAPARARVRDAQQVRVHAGRGEPDARADPPPLPFAPPCPPTRGAWR